MRTALAMLVMIFVFGSFPAPCADSIYAQFLYRRLAVAKLREQLGDPCAKSLIKDLILEARRLDISIPDWISGTARPSLRKNKVSMRSIKAYQAAIREASTKFQLPPELITAVIIVESMFDPAAISDKGAIGLMQLMPGTAKELGIRNPFDPRSNIMGGAYLLRKYLLEFRSLKRALAAYNAGPTWVRSGKKLPVETQAYISRVIQCYKLLCGNKN